MPAATRTRAAGVILCVVAVLIMTPLISAGPASANLVAPRSDCAAQENTHASEPAQENALRCLIEYARGHAGSGGMKANGNLERAAGRKSGDVKNCGFSHTACGRAADLYAHKFGYTSGTGSWQWGENLAWGKGKRGTARAVLEAWLASPPHRSTMLDGSFEHMGIGLKPKGDGAIWVLQVGCRGC